MKRFLLALIMMIYALGSLAQNQSLSTTGKAQSLCPIQGEKISKSLFVDYKGRRVYFCCSSCIADFKKDPDKYIKKLEADGVVLEKVQLKDARS